MARERSAAGISRHLLRQNLGSRITRVYPADKSAGARFYSATAYHSQSHQVRWRHVSKRLRHGSRSFVQDLSHMGKRAKQFIWFGRTDARDPAIHRLFIRERRRSESPLDFAVRSI